MKQINPEPCFEKDEINYIPFFYSFIFPVQNYSEIFTEIYKVLLALNAHFSLIKLPLKKFFSPVLYVHKSLKWTHI